MKKKVSIVISDTGPIISLAKINKLKILTSLFNEIYIPHAVWEELVEIDDNKEKEKIKSFFKNKVKHIKEKNIIPLIDYGEIEAIQLYQEMQADLLLIDDKRAKRIAEGLSIKCTGTLGMLYEAKTKGIIKKLKPLFLKLLKSDRYYSIKILNYILKKANEKEI